MIRRHRFFQDPALVSLILAAELFVGIRCADIEDESSELPNVYLDKLIDSEWKPGKAGSNRAGAGEGMIGDDLIPTKNNRALGPPSGWGWQKMGNDSTAVGVNGRAAWRFDKDYYIYDGQGDDFITFADHFAWKGEVDGLCCELAHVEVSEDLKHWYYNSAEKYKSNPDPSQNNDGYIHMKVSGLHGNHPTFANYKEDKQAYQIVDGKWEPVEGVWISKDFRPNDPYLGGDRFDLADFRSKKDDSPWPAQAKMRYLRIIDDDSILDGQDWDKSWALGAHMHAAMGINVKEM